MEALKSRDPGRALDLGHDGGEVANANFVHDARSKTGAQNALGDEPLVLRQFALGVQHGELRRSAGAARRTVVGLAGALDEIAGICAGDRILFPLYHPAAGLRNPAIKRDLQEDILRLPEALREALRASGGVPRPEPEATAAGAGPARPEPPEPDNENLLATPVAIAPSTEEHVPIAPLANAPPARTPEKQAAGAPVSEPVIERETKEKEEGDRQLGFF